MEGQAVGGVEGTGRLKVERSSEASKERMKEEGVKSH